MGSFEEPAGANGLLHDFPRLPGFLGEKSELIGKWEVEKWKRLEDAICEFARSPVATDGSFSSEKVNPALHAIATWINMVTLAPPRLIKGNPYWMDMDRTLTDTLNKLGSLHNDLRKHAGQLKPLNPTCGAHFVALANKIHIFILSMK